MAMYPPARGPEDAFNPYASPTAPLRRSEDEFGYPALRFGVSEVLSRSWAIYQSRMGFCIGVVVVWFALYFAGMILIGAIPAILSGLVDDPKVAGLLAFGLTIGLGLFVLWLNIGLTIVMVKVARGRLATIGDLFSGGGYILTTILAVLVLGLVGMGLMLVAMLPVLLAGAVAGPDPTTQTLVMIAAVGLASLFIVGMTLRLSQFTYFIVDRGVGAIESLQLSIRATAGRWLSLFLIFLLAGLINFAGTLAFGIGLIFTMPLGLLILAVTYTALADRERSASAVAPGWVKPEAPLDF